LVFPIVSSSNCYARSATLSLYFKIAEFFGSIVFYLQTLRCCNIEFVPVLWELVLSVLTTCPANAKQKRPVSLALIFT
jgi:hypothetical protein